MKNVVELFWKASIGEIKRGYTYDNNTEKYYCLICGKSFTEGIVYPDGDVLYEAKKAIEKHIESEHSSMFEYLINMDKKHTKLTEHQKKLLIYFYQGYSDREIINMLGVGSTSTVRNHRFKLKEREKQAKVFLTIMELLEDKMENNKTYHKNHKNDTNKD